MFHLFFIALKFIYNTKIFKNADLVNSLILNDAIILINLMEFCQFLT